MYIGIGGTYEEFMHLNPRKLEVIINGHKEKMKHMADELYQQAQYAFYAHTVALANFSIGFSGKHKKPLKFEDAVKRPNVLEEHKEEFTEEDKRKYTEALFTNLKLRMANFELSQGGKD